MRFLVCRVRVRTDMDRCLPPHHCPRHAGRMSRSSRQDPERVDEGQDG